MIDPAAMAPAFDPMMDEQGMPPMGGMDMSNVIQMLPPHVLQLQQQMATLQQLSEMPNAAEAFEPNDLNKLGAQVVREYEIDKDSRSDWEECARRSMDMARQKREAKSEPWDDASNVKFPMLTTASLQFAARAYPAILDGPRVVKCQVMGYDPNGMKAAAADRVSQHMSYQFLYEMEDWESDLDTALHQLPIVGCVFKKIYPDGTKPAGVCSDLVSAFDLVVNQKTKSLDTTPRITHVFTLYPHEIGDRQRDGRFLEDTKIEGCGDDTGDDDAPHTFLEQYRYWDSDEDGIAEPWIVTVHEKTQAVVRMTAGFRFDEIKVDQMRGRIVTIPRKKYFVKIPFIPDPEGGFYDIGFGKLLEPLSDVIDTTINQMMDAGTLQNAGGGFIASGVDLGRGKSKIAFKPGEFKTVQTAANDLRAGIFNMDHPGPSRTLFELLSLMIDAGKDIAAIQDILVGDMPRNQTATATMAMIEQGLKVFTAIYKRIFRALRQEYKLVFEINKATLNVPKYVALLDAPVQVSAQDYMGELDVMPTADPATLTDMQRMAKAQLVMEEFKSGNPHINGFAATKRALEAARVDQIEELLVPPPQEPPPQAKLAEAGAIAEIDLKKAQTVKTVVDAEVARAQIMQPITAPLPVALPVFGGSQMGGPGPMPGGPMPPMGPMDMDGGMPPMMQDGGPMPMGQEGPMPGDDGMSGGGMPPPEVMDQIMAEMAASGDAMPGDGMPIQP